MTMTLKKALATAVQQLYDAGIDTAALDAAVLMTHVTSKTRTELYLDEDEVLPADQLTAFQAAITRRVAHEPVAYITGTKEFWGLDFTVTPDVLIPRPDTETVVATVLAHVPDKTLAATAVDVGTGSGAIAIALLHECPQFHFTAVDVSPAALDVAAENAARHEVADRCNFVQGNLLEPVAGPVNLIVSNPPYITTAEMATLAPDVRQFEPHVALAAGADGLDCYRLLIPAAYDKLTAGGMLVLEIGHTQGADVSGLCRSAGFSVVKIIHDLSGKDRVVMAIKEMKS